MKINESKSLDITTISNNPYVQNYNSTDFIVRTNVSTSTIDVMFPASSEYKVYKRSWIILMLFVLYSASNAMHWIQYCIIANIIQRYYNVSNNWIDWTSMIFMILYIPLIFPASWVLEKMGLRWTVLFGAFGTCIASWVKVASVQPDLFYVGFIGQTIASISQMFVLSLPARIAAVWFGSEQVSFACSVGVFGNQLGIAMGFIIPPMLVENHDNLDLVGDDLQFLFYLFAGFCTILFILIIIFFQAEPVTPPSAAQEAAISSNESEHLLPSLKRLMTNRNFILLMLSYGMTVSVFFALSTLLNQLLMVYYPGHEMDAGRIGLLMVVCGMLGAVACGFILDRTHRFKETTLALCVFSMISMWIFTFTINLGNIWIVYVTAALLGFFMTGYLPVGFEFGVELTYPEPEGTSAGLLNLSTVCFGMFYTMLYSKLLDTYGDQCANISMAISLSVCICITIMIKSDLRRQAAQNGRN